MTFVNIGLTFSAGGSRGVRIEVNIRARKGHKYRRKTPLWTIVEAVRGPKQWSFFVVFESLKSVVICSRIVRYLDGLKMALGGHLGGHLGGQN